MNRINDRRLAEMGKGGGSKPKSFDMQDESNLMRLEMMMPGSVDFGN